MYRGASWSDQLYLLLTDIGETTTSLRIDVVPTSTPALDSSINIARINPNFEGAYHEAKFAEIKYESKDDGSEELHMFATLAY